VIVLFDLDGTVVTFGDGAPGPGRTAMGRASRALYGADHTEGMRFAGGTDRAIARTLLERANRPVEESAIQELLDTYVEHLLDVLKTRKYQPIGEVARAVEVCTSRGACVGVATGNIRRGAQIKLSSAGLGDVFSLDRGGYGCDHELRAEVVRKGIERCGGGERVVVVGDTQQDVDAARAVGALVVGVAVNEATRRELEEAGADAIVDTCGDALVEAIFSVAAPVPEASATG
jgi:phosphoglycolate phosphatase-like HAD superfamily hydrolase